MTTPGMTMVGDSALVADGQMTGGKERRGRNRNETRTVPESIEMTATHLFAQRVPQRKPRSAEWRVRALKVLFGVLQLALSVDCAKQKRFYNFCVSLLDARN